MQNSPSSFDTPSSSQSPPSVTPSLASVSTGTSSSSLSSGKSRSPSIKPPNVFSNDGSFLDRVKRSLKEEEEKKKAQEALERKKAFADRFRHRGKRQLSTSEPPEASQTEDSQANPSESGNSPQKKRKLADGGSDANQQDDNIKKDEEKNEEDNSPQAEYHRAIESYPSSLKNSGTGVRPLIK